jgi:hypothetical protein
MKVNSDTRTFCPSLNLREREGDLRKVAPQDTAAAAGEEEELCRSEQRIATLQWIESQNQQASLLHCSGNATSPDDGKGGCTTKRDGHLSVKRRRVCAS